MKTLRVLLLTLLVILFCVSAVSSEQIGWWKLNEGAGFVANDSSSGNHNGSIGSGQSWNGQGSLDFIGYTSSNTENSITFSSSDANEIFESVDSKMMISFWIKLYKPFELSKAYHCTRNGDMVSYVEFHPALGGVLRYKPNPETDCFVFNIFDPNSENYIDMSQWNHFLFVRDLENNTIEIYLNGKSLDFEIKYDNPPYASLTGINGFIIGGYNGTGHLKGSIKDFRVYDDSDSCCIDLQVDPNAGGPYVIRPKQELTFDGNDCFTDGAFGYGTSWYVDDYLVGQGGGMCNQGDCSESSKVSITFDDLVNAVGYGVHTVRLDMVSYNPTTECNCEKSATTTIMVAPDADFQPDGKVDFADFALLASAWQSTDFNTNLELYLKLDETSGTTITDETANGNNSTSARDAGLMKPLIAHWKMNDTGTDVIDDSGYGNDGASDNIIVSVGGKVSNAISIDGSTDHISVTNEPSLNFGVNMNFSIACWFRTSDDGNIKYIIQKWRGTDWPKSQYSLYKNSDNKLNFVIGDASGNYKTLESDSAINDGQWHHVIVACKRKTNAEMYIDGQLQGVVENISTLGNIDNVANLLIGTGADGNDYNWDGEIDDLRIYRGVLSQSQREDIYADGFGTESEIWNKDAIGSALFFNGVNDNINCGHDVSIENIFNGGGTLSCWLNIETVGKDSMGAVLDKSAGWRLTCYGNTSTMSFQSICNPSNGVWLFNIPLGWFHLAITYDKNSVSNNPIVYINSQSVTVYKVITPSGTGMSDSGKDLYIGDNQYKNKAFNGYIDDLRLYSNKLTSGEIFDIWTNTNAFTPAYDISQPQDGMIDLKDISILADFWLTGN